METRTILVGDDDADVRDYLSVTLRSSGYNVHLAPDGEGVVSHLSAGRPVSLVLLDIMMPNKDGWETLRDIRNMRLDLPVIMLSGMSSPHYVVQAIQNGANDFLAKPVTHENLGRVIERALGSQCREQRPGPKGAFDMFIGVNPVMEALKAWIPKVAASNVPVLIQGETGTGKEVLARQLHELSARANKPFVKLNCAALPAELIESEVFGHERGAFTGAAQKKCGLFETADGGTILLDEIGDMDVRLQAKLLQVLQDQQFRRVGGTEMVRVDVRVIAATHRDLVQAIRERTFREDLYYRLNVLTCTLPALRARKEDILSLTAFLISRHTPADTPRLELTPALQSALVAFRWPGNIRQLENVVRKLIVLRDPELIVQELEAMSREMDKEKDMDTFSAREDQPSSRENALAEPRNIFQNAARVKQEAEAAAILRALNSSGWNRIQAAAMLNIEYRTLLYKMKKLSIEKRASNMKLSA